MNTKQLKIILMLSVFAISMFTIIGTGVNAASSNTCKCNWFFASWVSQNNCLSGYTPKCNYFSCDCVGNGNNAKLNTAPAPAVNNKNKTIFLTAADNSKVIQGSSW